MSYFDVQIRFNENLPRPVMVDVDFTGCTSERSVHMRFAKALGFPEFYGCNWSAFWDAITGLAPMPERLVVRGWGHVARQLPGAARHVQGLLARMNDEYPSIACSVEYHVDGRG
jgi:ribonuclease inhibitor